jgi:hypothetical protein
MWPDLFRAFRRDKPANDATLFDVAHAVLLGDEADVKRTAEAWAVRQRDLMEQDAERERNAEAVEWLRLRVERSPAQCWMPGIDE